MFNPSNLPSKNFFPMPLLFIIFLLLQAYQAIVFAAPPDVYKVGNLDVLKINVAGRPAINEVFPVSSDGTISFPWLGNVWVAGLTVKEIEEKITGLLGQDYLVDPKVYVSMEKYNSQKVIVWGEVKSPGTYVLTGRATLLEIVAEAGGVTEKAGRRIMLFRHALDVVAGIDASEAVEGVMKKEGPTVIDIDRLVKGSGLEGDLTVSSGDVIVVEAQKDSDINEQRVYITGCLSNPGAYDYQNGLTALSLCIIAGGFTNRAAPQKATLVRKVKGEDKVYQIDLDRVKRGKAIDFELKPGDRLNVPESFW
ncbi:MAG: polysaccharide biosynthesis/export family protein [bacterium]